MARIPYPDPDDLSPETRELVENLPDLKILSMLAHADDSYSQYLLFVGRSKRCARVISIPRRCCRTRRLCSGSPTRS